MNAHGDPRVAAHGVASWLADSLTPSGFPARTFYGESFALWLWQQFSPEFDDAIHRIAPLAVKQALRKDESSHPEFNLFALWQYCQLAGVDPTDLLQRLPPLRRTRNLNWLLLGQLVTMLWGPVRPLRSRFHTDALLLSQQESSGLLRDDRLLAASIPVPFPFDRVGQARWRRRGEFSGRSLQYHSFSRSLLWDIFDVTSWPEVKNAAVKADRAIRHFIFDGGDTLYLGRGQQQIFGYGALLYALDRARWLDPWR